MGYIILLAVILLIFLYIFLPNKQIFEYFTQETIRSFTETSTSKYFETATEQEYMNIVSNTLIPDLLIMDRCIEFKAGDIETVINNLNTKFFISSKEVVSYTSFSHIETALTNKLIKLYTSSNMNFLEPIYVLITQYPRRYTSNGEDTCHVVPLVEYADSSLYSPLYSRECPDQQQYIECEFYILMPSHSPSNTIDIVGNPNNKSWEDIKKAMGVLLDQSVSDPSVINNRSKDTKCFTTCGNVAEDALYVCGARNGTSTTSYSSVVKNAQPNNNTTGDVPVDITSLYVIQTSVMKGYLSGYDFLVKGVSNTTLSSSAPIQEEVPTSKPQLPIDDMTDAQAICYAKKAGLETTDINVIKKHWNNFKQFNNYDYQCTTEYLPITDEELECYEYRKMAENENYTGDPAADYLNEYNPNSFDGKKDAIVCAHDITQDEADCYRNRYNVEDPNEHWRTYGFYKGNINSCDDGNLENFYKTLKEGEARCYQKLNDSLRYNETITPQEIQQHWLDKSNGATKERECDIAPPLTDEQAGCYINRHPHLQGKINDPKNHWAEYGFYEGLSSSCHLDDTKLDGTYINLTPDEATCFKRRTESLRDNINITTEELSALYFKDTLEGKDKTCIKNIPTLTNTGKECYVNRNRVILEEDKKKGFQIDDPQKHYEERGIYIGLSTDCGENNRYATITDNEAECYMINNPSLPKFRNLQEAKNHWYDIGSINKLDKGCYSYKDGRPCTKGTTCKYCTSSSTTNYDGTTRCGDPPKDFDNGKECDPKTSCERCKSNTTYKDDNGVIRCGTAPRDWDQGRICTPNTTCNRCASRTTYALNGITYCGPKPEWSNGRICAMGTTCAFCKNGHSYYDGATKCGPMPRDWGQGKVCGPGTTCNRCKDGKVYKEGGVSKCGTAPVWGDGKPCLAGSTCNFCKNRYSFYDHTTRCGTAPRDWGQGRVCGPGTTCNRCAAGRTYRVGFYTKCGTKPQPPPPPPTRRRNPSRGGGDRGRSTSRGRKRRGSKKKKSSNKKKSGGCSIM